MQALLDAIAAMPLPGDARRIFHGRGGLHPGCEQWTLDAYPPVFVLTSFAPVDEGQLAAAGDALRTRWAQLAPGEPLHWVFQHRGEALRLQGRSDTRLMAGGVPDPHVVTEGGLRFRVHALHGQNHGLFLDMAEGRRWVREWAADFKAREGRGARVLNLFAYTCGFSVAALAGGAHQVVNLDMARAALSRGRDNHRLNQHDLSQVVFLGHDLFKSWGKVAKYGPYDLIIIDPPSFQRGSFVLSKDYPKVLRRLPELLNANGVVLACSNEPEIGPDYLIQAMADEAPSLRFCERLANPPEFPDSQPDSALKALVFRRN